MVIGSTSDTFGPAQRDRIAEAWVDDLINLPTEQLLEKLTEISQEGFVGLRDMRSSEAFRIGMMLGYFNEDGEDR